jgi:hypothetical protein
VTSVRADEPFQVVVLRLPPPRKRVSVTLASPFCSFHILVPDGTPVHLGDHFPISLVSRGPARDAPIAEDEPGYDVTFGGPFGSLTIEEEPLPEGVRRRERADEPSPAATGPDDAEGARPPAEAPASPVPKRRPAEASPEADAPAAPEAEAPPRR